VDAAIDIRETAGAPATSVKEESGGHRLIADRVAAVFAQHVDEGFRLVTRETEIADEATGAAYRPELVLFGRSSDIHTIVELTGGEVMGERNTQRARCYRSIPSLENYVIVRADTPQITWFSRLDEKQWLFGAADDVKAVARLESPSLTLELAEIYEGVLAADGLSA
jgi:hypothetical protein